MREGDKVCGHGEEGGEAWGVCFDYGFEGGWVWEGCWSVAVVRWCGGGLERGRAFVSCSEEEGILVRELDALLMVT